MRLASVGTSAICAQFIAASHRVPSVTFTTAYSRDAERAQAFADANQIASTSSDYDELLHSDDVDGLYIASPNSIHFEQSLAALRAGKHVIVEKPATPDAASFQVLTQEAGKNGVVLLEAMRNAYDPGTEAIRQLLPELGTLRRASFSFCQRSSKYDALLAGQSYNVFDPAMAGGTLLDLGVYCLSAAVLLFGAPDSIVGRSIPLPTGADGAGAALLSYPGLLVEVSYSKMSDSALPSEIQGEQGTLLIDHIADPRQLRLQPLKGTPVAREISKPPGNLEYSLERFVALVNGDRDASSGHERTLTTLRLTDELRSPTGRAIDARRAV